MRLAIRLDRARLFRWHLELINRLAGAGFDARVSFSPTSEPLPVSLTALLDFDRVRARSGPDRFSVRMSPVAFDAAGAPPSFAADLTIDLSTSACVVRLPGRVLRPMFNGSAKDYALFHALLDGHAPAMAISDTSSSNAWPVGLPALERPHHFATSLDETTSRLLEGLIATIARIAAGEQPPAIEAQILQFPAAPKSESILASVGAFAAHRASSKTARIRDRLTRNRPKWHIGWRNVGDGDAPRSGLLSLSDFIVLQDDDQRFYADPFVFERDGARHLFFEELPIATGYGVIAHCIIAANGAPGPVTQVLDVGKHLSYPFVFERDGAIWMIPESASAGGIDLYRAERFPDRWTHAARLIDGRLHDATLFDYGGLLWIAAGSEAFQSSTWDGLSLFWSKSLLGPWRPHARNPVLVDARFARPAGPLWTSNGHLYRPAQDCTGGYGGKIAIQRVDELTPDTFAESRAGAIAFSADSRLLGPHTISRAGGVEAIDLYARTSDLRAGYREPYTL